MNSQIKTIIQSLRESTIDYTTFFAHLPPEALNWKPNNKSWSIGQVVEHINLINSSYHPIFDELINGSYKPHFFAKVGFLVRFFGNFLVKSVRPENRKKAVTAPIWEPSLSVISENIWEVFKAQQEKTIDYVSKLSSVQVERVIISSPANRIIVYPLEQAFEIIAEHEKRHLLQALEILSLYQLQGQT